ncbi:MAG: SusC/RagA family TonB-linked outer membrane protein, partial [Spirosomaceae bacterium]|nr:SusC/RagA family TonB-linked outer membrane protein [Spirosomataceae bacterium]
GPILESQYGVTNTEGTNWLDVITQNTTKKLYDLDFSGATEQGTNYFGSLGYANEQGVLINSGFQRLSGRLNIDQKIGKFVSAGLRMQYTNTEYEGLIGDYRVDNAVAQSTFLNPFINRDNVTGVAQGLVNNGGQGAGPESPEFRINQTIADRGSDWFSGNLNLSVKPTQWLEFAITAGLINESSERNYFVSRVLREARNTNGRAETERTRDSRWTLQPRMSINKTFNKHKINATFVYEARKQANDRLYSRYEQFNTEVLKNYTLTAAGQILAIPTYFDIRDRSYIGRAQYNYNSKYIVTASARIDESSRFLNDRTGFFPAISAAWNISDESFMDFADNYLSALKFRVGFGITGNNQIPVNSGLQLANIGTVGYPFNDAVNTSVTVTNRFANPDISWEITKGLNFGLDFGFLNDRIAISTNYYRNVTDGLLLDIQLPAYSSFNSSVKNLGSLENKGFEFELTSTNIIKRGFRWTTNFNIAWNRNQITDLGGQPELGFRVIGTGSNLDDVRLRVGQPIGVYYGTIQDGLVNNDFERYNSAPKVQDNNTGEFQFVDLNGNGDIERTEYVPIAYTMPKHTGGIGNTISYKGIDFYAFLRWTYGNDIVNNNLNRAHYLRGDNNLQTVVANDIWNRQNEDRNYQSYVAIFTTRSGSTFSRSEMVEDGSFLRFETLRLGYTIPTKYVQKVKVERAKITFTGQNLGILTRYSWFDPEVNAARGSNKNLFPGLDQGAYPRSRHYLLGLELGF